jgi:ankyrin repeat protein
MLSVRQTMNEAPFLPPDMLILIFEYVLRDEGDPFDAGHYLDYPGHISNWVKLSNLSKMARHIMANVRGNLTASPRMSNDDNAHILLALAGRFRKANVSALLSSPSDLSSIVATKIKALLTPVNMIAPCDAFGRTPLMVACAYGCLKVVETLMGVAVILDGGTKRSAAPGAIVPANALLVPRLLKATDDLGNTPLMHAASLSERRKTKVGIMTQLFAFGDPRISAQNEAGETALFLACSHLPKTDSEGISLDVLLKNGADTRIRATDGRTVLHAVAPRNIYFDPTLGIPRFMDRLQPRPIINARDKYGETPLLVACRRGAISVGATFIALGADVSICANDGTAPLQLACRLGSDELARNGLVRRMLDGGADPLAGSDGTNSLHAVCGIGASHAVVNPEDEALLNMLITAGARARGGAAEVINMQSRGGRTPLYIAAHCGRDDLASILLGRGGAVNLAADFGVTPLMAACYQGNTAVVKLLLQNRADVNLQDADGNTALHWLAGWCRNEEEGGGPQIALLMDYGANKSITNVEDKTAYGMVVDDPEVDFVFYNFDSHGPGVIMRDRDTGEDVCRLSENKVSEIEREDEGHFEWRGMEYQLAADPTVANPRDEYEAPIMYVVEA